VRQPILIVPIHPRAAYSTQKCNQDHQCSRTDLGEEGTRTSAGHGPTQAENGATYDLAFVEFFRVKLDHFAVDGFDLVFFDQPDGQGTE